MPNHTLPASVPPCQYGVNQQPIMESCPCFLALQVRILHFLCAELQYSSIRIACFPLQIIIPNPISALRGAEQHSQHRHQAVISPPSSASTPLSRSSVANEHGIHCPPGDPAVHTLPQRERERKFRNLGRYTKRKGRQKILTLAVLKGPTRTRQIVHGNGTKSGEATPQQSEMKSVRDPGQQ